MSAPPPTSLWVILGGALFWLAVLVTWPGLFLAVTIGLGVHLLFWGGVCALYYGLPWLWRRRAR